MANAFQEAAEVIARLADVAKGADAIIEKMESAEKEARAASVRIEKAVESFEGLAEEVREKSQVTSDAVKAVHAAIDQHAKAKQDIHRDLSQLKKAFVGVRQKVLSATERMQADLSRTERRILEQQARAEKRLANLEMATGVAIVVMLAVLGISIAKS